MEVQLEAHRYAVLLLPDEHREALQSLLLFLNDLSKHSDKNQVSIPFALLQLLLLYSATFAKRFFYVLTIEQLDDI